MEIKAETTKDKVYTNIGNWWGLYLAVVTITIFIFYAFNSIDDGNKKLMDLAIAADKNYNASVKLVIDTKPPLVCGKQSNIYLNGNQYDITEIDRTIYVVTQDTRTKPKTSLRLRHCEIIKTKTNTMKIIVPDVVPIDEKHAMEIERLETTITKLMNENSTFKNKKMNYEDALEEANRRVSELSNIIEKQQVIVGNTRIVEAKYKELKDILDLMLSNTSIVIPSRLVKAEIPKPSIKVKEILEKVATPVVVKKTQISFTSDIADDKEYIQRLIYTIKELNRMGSDPKEIVRAPTKEELHAVVVTQTQSKNATHVISQLKLAVSTMVNVYAKRFLFSQEAVRNSIRKNVGV